MKNLSKKLVLFLILFVFISGSIFAASDEDDDDYDTTFEGSDIEIKYHYTSGKEKNE